jgi:hypothetical protein
MATTSLEAPCVGHPGWYVAFVVDIPIDQPTD